VTSTNTKPEVVFSGCGRRVEKWIWRHGSIKRWEKLDDFATDHESDGHTDGIAITYTALASRGISL